MTGRVLKFLGSLRFTLFLILTLSVVFLLGLWIPQKGLIQIDLYLQWKAKAPVIVSVLDALGLTSIYTSPLTLALWLLFFLNLTLVMGKRLRVVKEKLSLPDSTGRAPASFEAYPVRKSVQLASGEGIDAATAVLRESGYCMSRTSEWFFAVKNRLSPAATLLFHLSFFLILLGGMISVYTRFAGDVNLAEGEAFSGELARYNAEPRLPKIGGPPQVRILVEKVEPAIEQRTPLGLKVTLRDGRGERHVTEINRPYKTGDTSFVIKNLGVAPLFILRNGKGAELDGAYVKLNVLKGKEDTFAMGGLQFAVHFFPDYSDGNGVDDSRTDEMKNPAFRLHIQQDRTFLARPLLRPGETIRFGDYELELREMPLWVRFYVIKEHGLWVIYSGFAVAIIALVWRLMFYRREIIGAVRQENGQALLYLAGRAEFFQLLFEDEFNNLTGKIISSFADKRDSR